MSNIITVTQQTFKSTVVESDLPVLVDFWAQWCQPCLRMNPTLEELAEEMDGRAVVAKVNVDEERALAAMFQVMSIPALMVFKDGKKVAELTGLQQKGTLVEKLESLA
ncbi:MAG TPA: thioredoxin [Candidatus Corynebacterium intestinavium]|uniref:Thioredoxin n=1 Tax=Candidatus Corynebacterium intestinavium TaxID=2838531 RepID=A0A9D2UD34_9CORY|nr:thioredoxin [Candidatus Corynebacterium intestinavium]